MTAMKEQYERCLTEQMILTVQGYVHTLAHLPELINPRRLCTLHSQCGDAKTPKKRHFGASKIVLGSLIQDWLHQGPYDVSGKLLVN